MKVNTRTKVIEYAVQLEDLVSQLLMDVLDIDIDKKESLSFGSKNLALSFNSKINLLVDLKFVSAKISSDFQLFAEIRNKFAHVYYVDNFTKCFEILKDRKNKFKSYGEKASEQSLGEEEYLNNCFNALCSNLSTWLSAAIENLSRKKMNDLNKNSVIDLMKLFLISKELDNVLQQQEIISEIEPLVFEIDTKFDFVKALEIAIIKKLKP